MKGEGKTVRRGFRGWSQNVVSPALLMLLLVLVDWWHFEVWMDVSEAIKDGDGPAGAQKIESKI
jgi:hypothetical protein